MSIDIFIPVHALDILGDPVRRRIMELLATGEHPAGAVVDAISAEFGITQPAVSQHLKVLRESGFATVRAEGTRRLYAVDPAPLREVDRWLDQFRQYWSSRLDALGTEIARGKRSRQLSAQPKEESK
ncbi:MAG TPA: metalloregulator ArsR/SmtB family transcription factor [Propionibacteriaceae bacterium]|nr:metalloregulator ArsR/SmtB family transcription factor [Propionibacteriaceae bacterium]